MKEIELKDFIIFTNFADNETIMKAVSLFSNYNKADYISLQREMAASMDSAAVNGTYWQNYIVNLLAVSENIFTLSAEKGIDLYDTKIMKLAALELTTIKELYQLDFNELTDSMSDSHSHIAIAQNIAADSPKLKDHNNKRNEIVHAIINDDFEKGMEELYNYFNKYGSGLLEGYDVFEWDEGFMGVANHDEVDFDDLIGYDLEKQKLIENTEFLLDGKKAANALLYGDSGTGKSSSVKALIKKYSSRGLKLISIDKDQIRELSKILDYTRQRGCKFLIFIDDLSFEENDVEYKHFKSVLEGDVKNEPDNTVIYVTSNRRNIIREVWSEREGSDDIHLRDTLQEKKSLSDRFGLVITYSSPDKEEYLDIVKGLAKKNNIDVNEELLSEALKWDVRRAGRSGRTAKYFIDYYISANKLKA